MVLRFNILMRAILAGGSGVPSPITALITTNRVSASNTGVAPFAVHFDATGTTASGVSNPFRDLYHSWNFGDNPTDTWAYGLQPGVAKKNLASGGVAAHVYETPGTYTVNYICINPMTGDATSASITITVLDPDVVFAGTATICIANGATPVPGVNGVPAGASCQNVSTWAGVLALLATGKRLLLRRGDTWQTNNTGLQNIAGPGIVGAYGTGAAPKITYATNARTAFNAGATGLTDWRFMDLESEASALAPGTARAATIFLFSGSYATPDAGNHCLLLRINHHHAGTFATLGNDSIVADCDLSYISGGGGNVGIFSETTVRLAVLGTSVNDATGAEHCIRLQGTQRSVVSNCTLLNPANSKHALTIRGYADPGTYAWYGVYSEYCVVSDNDMDGGTSDIAVHFTATNASLDERHRLIVVERNRVKSTKNYGSCILASVSASAFRNNLLSGNSGTEFGLVLTDSPATASNGSAVLPPTDVQVYNNSYYSANVVTHAVEFLYITSAAATGIDVKNNVTYMPACTKSCKSVLAAVGAVYTASNNTVDGNITTTSPNFTTTPPVTVADWRPTSGYAVNTGVQVPVYDDVLGVVRTGTFDMGALQP